MAVQVKPKDNLIWFERVPGLAWGTGRDCTFAGALEAAMAVTDHPYSYADIMGFSGLAFRVRWCNEDTKTRWCGSCAVGEMPDEQAALARLTGWPLPTDVQFAAQDPDTDRIRQKIVNSIDAGQPVAAYATTLDMAIVYGYEEGGSTLLVSDYSQEEEPFRLPADEIGPMQMYLGEYTEPPSRRDALIEALDSAVQSWRRERHNGGVEGREYWYGDAAFRAWSGDLGRFDAFDEQTKQAMFGLNRWNYVCLCDARRAAIVFLREQASFLDGAAGKALARAADQYQHVVEILEPVLTEVQALADVSDWSREARLREIEVLEKVHQFESKAIADIELALTAATAPVGSEVMILGGVDRYRVMDPLFECVRVVLSYRGETYSPAYIQGISGAAFRIGGICPCAPTCACAMGTQDLVKLLGYEVEYLPLFGKGIDPGTQVHEVLARVKAEVRAGRPVILWHAFTTCEWDVVCGFDDVQHQFLGRGSYVGWQEYVAADQMRTIACTAICPALGAILIGDRIGAFNARAAEMAALKEAVRHAHSTRNQDKLGGEQWTMLDGLLCYDRWVGDFQGDPPKLPDVGDRYCLGVYRSTHRAASEFLRELAPRYPQATEHLNRAARHFAREASALNECAELLFPDWKLPEQADPSVNARAATLLSQAREGYARGIDEIERALEGIARQNGQT